MDDLYVHNSNSLWNIIHSMSTKGVMKKKGVMKRVAPQDEDDDGMPTKRRRLMIEEKNEEKKLQAPLRVFPPPPPPECLLVSQEELTQLAGTRYVLLESGFLDNKLKDLLPEELTIVVTQRQRTEQDDDCHDPVVTGDTSVIFRDKNGNPHAMCRWNQIATKLALFRLVGRPRYRKAVLSTLLMGVDSPNSSLHRAFAGPLGELNILRCIMDF
jgi:hypothetical protein